MITRKKGALLLRGRCAKIISSAHQAHQNVIIRELSSITGVIKPLEAQKRAKGFITASDDAGRIKDCIQKIEHALMVYQVCPPGRFTESNADQKRTARCLS
jgi:hypothetical protein